MNIQNLQQKNGTLLTVNQSSYSHENPIKFLTKSIESSPCGYLDAYILVTGNIVVTWIIAAAGDDPVKNKQPLTAATQVAFLKLCAI